MDTNNIAKMREQFMDMYNSVDEDNDVTFITIVTTSMGMIKCNNLNRLKLNLIEQENGKVSELAYDYRLTNSALEEVKKVFQQANIVNIEGITKPFKILSHTIFGGEVDMIRPKTEIIFKDTYFIAKYVESMDERFKHVIIKYEDFEYMFTQ